MAGKLAQKAAPCGTKGTKGALATRRSPRNFLFFSPEKADPRPLWQDVRFRSTRSQDSAGGSAPCAILRFGRGISVPREWS